MTALIATAASTNIAPTLFQRTFKSTTPFSLAPAGAQLPPAPCCSTHEVKDWFAAGTNTSLYGQPYVPSISVGALPTAAQHGARVSLWPDSTAQPIAIQIHISLV